MIKIIKESLSPEVGPFYVIDGAVFADTEDSREVDLVGGFKDSNNSHYDFWRSLKNFYPEFRKIDYDFYPRGRVVYSSKDDTYRLFADKCILKDSEVVGSIIDELGLPRNKVVIGDDEHYQCHQCDSEYVRVAENFK